MGREGLVTPACPRRRAVLQGDRAFQDLVLGLGRPEGRCMSLGSQKCAALPLILFFSWHLSN